MSTGPNKIPADYNTTDIYLEYCNYCTTIKHEEYVDRRKYLAILYETNKMIMNKIIEESKEVFIPWLGIFRVKKGNTIAMAHFNHSSGTDGWYVPKDWAASKKAGKWVYHLNEHRGGHKYKFYWKKTAIQNIKPYRFKASRGNARRLGYILKNVMTIDYFE